MTQRTTAATDTTTEITALRQELQALRQELGRVQRRLARPQRSFRRLLPFLLAALLVAMIPLASLAASFVDLNPGSPHNADINTVADLGISKGCTDSSHYCPNDYVTRQQMASFLARTARLHRITFNRSTGATYFPTTTTTEMDLLTVTLEVPTWSYVYVTFSGFALANTTTGCPCALAFYVRQDSEGGYPLSTANLVRSGTNTDLVGGYDRSGVSGADVWTAAPGTHTYTLSMVRIAGTSTGVGMSVPRLEAIPFPFGGAGLPATP